jgi:energy-coupling factor transport system permease protein
VNPHRLLHPGAWWVWAGCLAVAAMRTTNVLVLAVVLAVVSFVVSARRQSGPWARSFGAFFKLGIALVIIRLLLAIAFGVRLPGTTLFTVPSFGLPEWASGVTLGGPVTIELVVDAFAQGLRLTAVLVCFGAVNALCSPYRLLRALPAVLYEAGVVVTVAFAFAPQAVVAVGRLREARRLRGRPTKGLRGARGMAIPVLEDALERSVALAASMDSRGYGRRSDLTPRARAVTSVCTAIGLLSACIGVYGVLDAGAPRALALPMVGVGATALAAGLFAKGRHASRTRYRPDSWRAPEAVVAASGVVALVAFVATAAVMPDALQPSSVPLTLPPVPVVAIAGLIVALLPAWVAPRIPTLADSIVAGDFSVDADHAPVAA